MYVGEDLLLKVRASNPVTGHVARSSTVVAQLYAPGKNPRVSADDRADPDALVTLLFDIELDAYYGATPTVGWEVGVWTMLVDLTGELAGHVYRDFQLVAG